MTDATKPPEERDGGREALIKATVSVVAEQGIRGLTYRAVAQKAGVAHGLVAHHFGSRDALIIAAFREDARTREANLELSPGTGRIDDIGANLSSIIANQPHEERYQYEMILESLRRPELIEDVRQIYRGYVAALEDELRLAGADRLGPLAQVVFAALDGLAIQQLINSDPAETERAIERLRSLIRADIAVSRLKESLASE
ncbi:TetR/AcrR family transcriptional regulator [Okibacterium endophyticum]